MSIAELGHASTIAGTQQRQPGGKESFARFRIGQQVDVYIRQQLAANRYLVEFAGTQHVVEAAMSLTAGTTLAASVTAIGDKLELKIAAFAGSKPGATADRTVPLPRERQDETAELLDGIAQDCAVVLNDTDHSILASAMRAVAQPLDMAQAGLFLTKLQRPIEAAALQSLYAALAWMATPSSAADTAGDAIDLAGKNVAELAAAIEQQLHAGIDTATAASTGERDGEQLAHRLLNEQDDSSVGYAYGSLPILIADQLVELDVVLFRDRRAADDSTARKRLVMTLQTAHLGRVEIMAQSLGARLTIAIRTDTAAASAALAAHADEARALVADLGWNVEAIEYDVDPLRTRAPRTIVEHVLQAGSVDRLV